MAATGKIARLPRIIRDELNRRLEDGEPGTQLVAWLNAREDVQAIMAEHFGGRPINKPNLTAWREGGFRAWQAHRQLFDDAQLAAENAAELEADGSSLTGHLSTLLAARYATVLANWDGEPGTPAAQRLQALCALRQDIAILRRGDYNAARLRLEQQRFDFECQKALAELKDEADFQEHKLAMLNRILGRKPAPDASPAESPPPKSSSDGLGIPPPELS
jgi:hypothetical protein